MIDLTKEIELTDKPNFVAQPIADAVYAELMTGSSADMMLESVTIDDVDHAYLGDEMLYVSIATGKAMFEAVTSERLRLSQTMRAFARSLNRGLNGTGIKAGTDDAGIDEEGRKTIGGAIIGKVRRVNNIPIMTALIPLSDGQSISLIFHSPTSDNGQIKNSDLLVAFRFLLNKRDVTHIVAPIGGRDVSLQQVSQALANLAERNSAKFTKQQSAQVKLRADIEGLNAEADQLSEQYSLRDSKNPTAVITGKTRPLDLSVKGMNEEYLLIDQRYLEAGTWLLSVRVTHGNSRMNPLYRIFPVQESITRSYGVTKDEQGVFSVIN